jgi:hydrogenase expression/formation protein HypE
MPEDIILLSHGSGGLMMHRLIDGVFVSAFGGPDSGLGVEDAASLELNIGPGERLAMTTDSFVVSPMFFPGGDIGDLAINGTVNDLAVSGAKPLYLTTGFIIEEGTKVSDLKRIAGSMKAAADKAGVRIVAGDTKVVDRGKADGVFINTAGVGVVPSGVSLSASGVRPGDAIIVSGTIGDHGMAVMSVREGLSFGTTIVTDSAPLNSLVSDMLNVCPDIRALRDPTRGGLAATLNEFASASGVGITITERDIPVREEVRGACEFLGLDAMYVANEGKLVAAVPSGRAEEVLAAMKKNPYGVDSAIIGEAAAENPGKLMIRTSIGGTRIVDMPAGELLPRIC